jgi:hypothetical protein
MPLALYRRHRQNCKAGYKHNTSEYDERKKGRPRCECPIFVSGSLRREFRRHNTGKWEWTDARAIAQQFEDAGSWTVIPEPPPPDTEARKIARVTIDRAVKAFTAEFEEHAATNTQKKYRILLAKLRTFAETKGYVMLEQWTPMDIREMRISWDVAPQTAAKNMSTVKAFFEFCVGNDWLPKNPARYVKRQRSRDAADRRNEQKLPFSDDEIKRMYETCESRYGKQEIRWDRSIPFGQNIHAARL